MKNLPNVYITVENVRIRCLKNILNFGNMMEKPKTADHHGVMVIHPDLVIATNYAIIGNFQNLKTE